ncbi:hypothetical protein D3C81_1976230 [compost metagenome]
MSLELERFDGQINQAATERDEALEKMQIALNELAALQQQNGEATEKVKEVQAELDKFKTTVDFKTPIKWRVTKNWDYLSNDESMKKILATLTSSTISNPPFGKVKIKDEDENKDD